MGLRLGFGIGPLRASVPLLPRSRRRRRSSDSGCGVILALAVLLIFAIWPYLLLQKHHHALAVVALSLWLALLAGSWILVAVGRSRQRAERRQQRAAQHAQLVAYRVQMAATNTPWLDPELRAFRHGTCTIRHRSEGAAARCRSQV